MDLFCGEWQLRNPGRDCLLLGDQLQSHKQVDVVWSALKYKLHLWWLVADTSHFLQVLDDKCFAVLKTHERILSEEKIFRALLTSQPTRDCVLQAAYKAERIAFTPATIRASFRSVGLVLFDRQRVLHPVRLNLRMDLPQDDVADQARAAAALVIRQCHDQHAADSRTVVARRSTVKKGRIYSGGDLLDAHRAEVAASAAVAAAKADKAAARYAEQVKATQEKEQQRRQLVRATCRPGTTRTHRGGAGWSVCPCVSLCVCPLGFKFGDGKALMGAHSVACPDLV